MMPASPFKISQRQHTRRPDISHPDGRERWPFVRFLACEEDLSHELPDSSLPRAVALGAEPFLVIGALAGG